MVGLRDRTGQRKADEVEPLLQVGQDNVQQCQTDGGLEVDENRTRMMQCVRGMGMRAMGQCHDVKGGSNLGSRKMVQNREDSARSIQGMRDLCV